MEKATFAGGCFWCMQAAFRNMTGVKEVISGYSGGYTPNPTYEEVSSGATGHREAIQITYDPEKIDYEILLEFFFRNIDFKDKGGQFADRGFQYTTTVFYHNDKQKLIAQKFIEKLSEQEYVATKILKYENFYSAENYHQDYDLKHPFQYGMYKKFSGR